MPRPDGFIHENVAPLPGTFSSLRVREDVAYTDARGRQKGGIRKSAQKLLPQVESILARMLRPSEAIFYVARMNTPISQVEQLTAGWLLYTTVGAVMVFTNERIICLPVTYNGKWKGSVRIVWYSDLDTRTRVSGLLNKALEVQYGMGKKDRFWGLKRRDAKKLKMLLPLFLAENSATPVSTGMVSLCPECLKPLTPEVYECGSCGLVFKDERTMRKRALLIPGGGYFYCGATGMGILAAFVEAYALLEIVLALIGMVLALTTSGPGQEELFGGSTVVVIIFAAFLGLEKLIQIHHCQRIIREFHSTGKKKDVAAAVAAFKL